MTGRPHRTLLLAGIVLAATAAARPATTQRATAQKPKSIAWTIRDADADTVPDRLDRTITVEGCVTTAPYPATQDGVPEFRAYIQDDRAGLRLTAKKIESFGALILGDRVRVRGRLGHYNGTPFLAVESLTKRGTIAVPPPIPVPLAEAAAESLTGRLVRVEGNLMRLASGKAYLMVGARQLRVFLRPERIYEKLAADPNAPPRVSVVGVLEQYDTKPPYTGGYRVRPRSRQDITFLQPETTGLPWWAYVLFGGGGALVLFAAFAAGRRSRPTTLALTDGPSHGDPQVERMQALGTLAGGIAHDFNNYLLAITGFAELTKEQLPQGSLARQNVDEVLGASKRAKTMIEEILEFSRTESDALTPLDARAAVLAGLRLLRAVLPASVDVNEEIEGNCGRILADQGQLHQLLLNLGSNARDSMKGRSGMLTIRLRRVELTDAEARAYEVDKGGSFVELCAEDTGDGMDQETVRRVCEPFFTTKVEGAGTGLGMSVVHGILQRHGAGMKVESEPGHGSRFAFLFPAIETVSLDDSAVIDVEALTLPAEPKAAEPIVDPPPPVAEPTDTPSGSRILFVDDEHYIVRLVRQQLERLGYQAVGETDADAALERFRQQPDDFDLVFTDVAMPNRSGVELAQEIRKIRPDQPILLTTGNLDESMRERMQEAGITELLKKPYTSEKLATKLAEILARNSRPTTA